jgi:hypothetical protein
MDEIKKLSEINEEQLNQALTVFVDGFHNVLSTIDLLRNHKYCVEIKK